MYWFWWEFLSWTDAEFCQVLFLYLLYWDKHVGFADVVSHWWICILSHPCELATLGWIQHDLCIWSFSMVILQFSSVQSLSRVRLFATPRTEACQAFLSITSSWSLLKLIESMMPSNYLILCRPLPLLPSIFPSIRVFSSELVFPIRWTKYWTFSFSISPSNECSGLISFRIDWFDLLAVQGTLKSLCQHTVQKH